MTASAYPEIRALNAITDESASRRDGHSMPPPDDAHDRVLMHRIKSGDFDTRQQLVASNLLHVLRSNKHYARGGARIFDLLKAGNRGVVHALENFEAESSDRFSIYAAACIRQHIEQALNLKRVPPAQAGRAQGGSPGARAQCA